MLRLWFDNGVKPRIIARVKNEKVAIAAIRVFCKERNFKIHYIRKWKEMKPCGCVDVPHYVYDVGSHTQFFYLEIRETE